MLMTTALPSTGSGLYLSKSIDAIIDTYTDMSLFGCSVDRQYRLRHPSKFLGKAEMQEDG